MKTAEQWRLEMMKVIFTAPVRANATITCDFAKQQDRDAFREVVQKSIDEARAEGFKAGQIAMKQQAVTICDEVPELRQCYTTDTNKAKGIKHAATVCATAIRNLPIQDEPHE